MTPHHWEHAFIHLCPAFFMDISILEDETAVLSQNIGNQLHSHVASYPRRMEISKMK
jgi:hypothetical protein